MEHVEFKIKLLHPKYWPAWLGIIIWWLLVNLLPLPVLIWLGNGIGKLLYNIGGSRKHIAETNIRLCFPHASEQEQEQLVRATLCETAIAILESGAAWFWPNWRFKGKYSVQGKEYIDKAIEQNKGVLFLGIHFTTIEIGASIVNLEFPISGFYRPHTNAVYEYAQAIGRIRRNEKSSVIPNEDVRGIIKSLRTGRIINYAPDQDYGKRRSVFAPFFGIEAATVKAPSQLSSTGRAEVIPWITARDPDTNQYTIRILAPITNKLGKSEEQDAITINTLIEAEVRKNPNQYLWVHRRFKTRPEGEDKLY